MEASLNELSSQVGRVADALFAQAKAMRDSARASQEQTEISKAMLMTQIALMENSRQLEAKLMQSLQDSVAPTIQPANFGKKPN